MRKLHGHADAGRQEEKVKKSKFAAARADGFRSGLEKMAWSMLSEAGILFDYEPFAIELLPAFSTVSDVWEGDKKGLKLKSKKVRPIHYTPDFVGSWWLMETKGMKTPDFMIKWKLLKALLKDYPEIVLFMPRNKAQIAQAIEVIQQMKQYDAYRYTNVLRFPKDKQLVAVGNDEPKNGLTKKESTRVVRRRRSNSI